MFLPTTRSTRRAARRGQAWGGLESLQIRCPARIRKANWPLTQLLPSGLRLPFRSAILRGGTELTAALGLEVCCLFFDSGEQCVPVRGEGACAVALQVFGEGIGVDTGVGGR